MRIELMYQNEFTLLEKQGYVVVKKVLLENEIVRGRDLLWDHIEEMTDGVNRNDPSTWSRWKLDARGFVDGVHQSKGAWYLRTLPRVKQVFASFWKTENLIVSMDGVIAWKPPPWQPETEGLHIDQHPILIPKFECVQGMIPLYDVTAETGGLEVIPNSHLDDMTSDVDEQWSVGWCPLSPNRWPQGSGKLLKADAGDLILWDGRTVHGGVTGNGSYKQDTLRRLSAVITMVPRSMASEHVLEQRKKAIAEGFGFTHRPHFADRQEGRNPLFDYKPIALSQHQWTFV